MMKKILLFCLFFGVIGCGFMILTFDRITVKKIINSIEDENFELFEKLIQDTDLDKNPYLFDLDRVNVSPLHFACKNGKYEYVISLVEAGADINNSNNSLKMSPLIITLANSSNENRFKIAKYLIEKGADLNIETYGDTALNYVFRNNSLAYDEIQEKEEYYFAKYLIEKGAKFDKGRLGHLIFDSAKMNNKMMVEYLINTGVNINMVDSFYGNSILMWAVMNDSYNVAKFLLENDIDTTIVNDDGKTAIDIARENKNDKIIEILNEYTK